MGWHVISTTPGFETKIKNSIETASIFKNISKKVMVPVVQKKNVVNGKAHFYNEKLFPGYIFVECDKNDYDEIFSSLSAFTGILNMSSIRSVHRISYEIEEDEMINVLNLMNGQEAIINKSSKNFKVNDKVKIISGPFSNFEGVIKEVKESSNVETKIKVCTRLFNNDLTYLIVSEIQLEAI